MNWICMSCKIDVIIQFSSPENSNIQARLREPVQFGCEEMCLSNTHCTSRDIIYRHDMVSYKIYMRRVLTWMWPWLSLVFHNDFHGACVWAWAGLNIHVLSAASVQPWPHLMFYNDSLSVCMCVGGWGGVLSFTSVIHDLDYIVSRLRLLTGQIGSQWSRLPPHWPKLKAGI